MSNVKVELHNPDNADEKWLPKTCAEQVFMEDGTDVESAITKNDLGTMVEISSYNSATNFFTIPTDGYIRVQTGNANGDRVEIMCRGSKSTNAIMQSCYSNGVRQGFSIFVKKGMRFHVSSSAGTFVAYFFPLN